MKAPDHTPGIIKANAIALLALGYSCRSVEKQLRQKFPAAHIPNYATISRWLRPNNSTRAAEWRWLMVADRAVDIVDARFDEIRTMSFPQMLRAAMRMSDIAMSVSSSRRR